MKFSIHKILLFTSILLMLVLLSMSCSSKNNNDINNTAVTDDSNNSNNTSAENPADNTTEVDIPGTNDSGTLISSDNSSSVSDNSGSGPDTSNQGTESSNNKDNDTDNSGNDSIDNSDTNTGSKASDSSTDSGSKTSDSSTDSSSKTSDSNASSDSSNSSSSDSDKASDSAASDSKDNNTSSDSNNSAQDKQTTENSQASDTAQVTDTDNSTNGNVTIEDNGHVIVIDAGHQSRGNYDEEPIGPGSDITKPKVSSGTQGAFTGVPEYKLNLAVAKKVEKELIARGYKVIMIREKNDVNLSNKERAEIANKSGADLFIRIHADGSTNSSVNGTSTLYPSKDNPFVPELNKDSYSLAKSIVDAICDSTGGKNRGAIAHDDMSGINWCTIPVTIIEMGYMTNEKEDRLMETDEYQDKITQGICNGIDDYFN